MNLLKKLALSTMLLASQSAFAQMYQLGNITPASAISFETATSDGNYDYIDYFTFNLTADAATLFGSAPDVKVKENGLKFKTNITEVLLYSGEISFADAVSGDKDKSAEGFSFKNIKAGTYYFAVAGQQRATLSGNYTFNLAATPAKIVSSVTEPESFALMLAGLGVLGFLVRKSNAA